MLSIDEGAARLRDSLELLTPYGVAVRCPGMGYTPDPSAAAGARAAAQQVMDWLQKALPEAFGEAGPTDRE